MPRKSKPTSRRAVPEERVDAAERALERAVNDPLLIEGIYNYCDRWCERCPLTARCLTFKMEQSRRGRRDGGGTAPDDAGNAAFWDDVATSFALALRLARRAAEEHGIDLDAPDALVEAEREERQRRQIAARQGSALHRAASGYWKAAKALIEGLPPELAATEEALNTQARLGARNPHAVAADIRNALEVVKWYLFFIDVKLQRAVSSRVDQQQEPEDNYPSDADGSAKVALIAIDRSLAAWARLREHLTGEPDAILDLLVQLERLRRRVEREFPQARAFKRPGFD